MNTHRPVLILDYGSQYTQLIARRIREMHVSSLILPPSESVERLDALDPLAVVLSGGPNSVDEPGAPGLPPGFLEWRQRRKLPVLGICYGMQLLARDLGGRVEHAATREYGKMEVLPENARPSSILAPSAFQAWMSHGDEVVRLPPGFELTAKSRNGAAAAMENLSEKIFAIQFHPEVTHTEHGRELLQRFVFDLSHAAGDWTPRSIAEEQIERIRNQVPVNQHVICALSGGVDSTVAAVLVHRAIGNRLHCVFVDHGLLRYDERNRVMNLFEKHLHLPVKAVDASARFLSKLSGVADPEEKRKRIGAEFIAVFDDEAQELQKSLGTLPSFLVQGTLYPDVIESSPPPGTASTLGGGRTQSAKIKSHHNVGGLPKDLRFKLLEPLRELFKDEVRALGRELAIPGEFLDRHPFPGPGLAVRILGEVTPERIKVLQQVDEIYLQELRKAGLYSQIWQAFAVFLPVRSVGVQGDGRTHDHVVALRAVTSSDGMTADWYPFSGEFLAHVSRRICNEVRGVSRVVYDVTSKPPATIEWE